MALSTICCRLRLIQLQDIAYQSIRKLNLTNNQGFKNPGVLSVLLNDLVGL